MDNKPNHAFILAAGKGTRLRPYTDTMPKPMVPVNRKPILDYTLEKLEKAGVKKVTINLNYLGDRIEKYYKARLSPTIQFSHEEALLDTGGAVKHALANMEGKPFYFINGDALWSDSEDETALDRLAEQWNPDEMDILLLLQPIESMTLTGGVGDYDLDINGRAVRSLDKTGAYMFSGIRISKSDIFEGIEEDVFSFRDLMDTAQEKGRLHAIVHDGEWHHISTPEDLESVNAAFKSEAKGAAALNKAKTA